MRKTREEKAITLIALIITIVVLLILAVVAINAVTGDGIIQHATNAKTEYEKAQDYEEKMLGYYTGVLQTGEIVPTVEQLEEEHKFKYYSSLSKAITDANNNTTENKDANKENGVAGIYTDENGLVVVLLKDTTESTRMTPTRDMTINLGGNILTMNGDRVVFDGTDTYTATITIDGRLYGSGINIQNNSDNAYVIQTRLNNFNINGGTYISNSTNGFARGVFNEGILNMNNCNIYVSSDTDNAYGVTNHGTATISSCNIVADAPGGEIDGIRAVGVVNFSGILTFNSGNVTGTIAGLTSELGAKTYIYGGTFNSCNYGGIRILTGIDGETYIENATITCSKYTGKYTNFENKDRMLAGFFIGLGSGEKYSNNSVYMNNCNVSGGIVISGSNGAMGNKLYISNSKVSGNAQVDAGQELNIGINTNLTTTGTGNINETGISYKGYDKILQAEN